MAHSKNMATLRAMAWERAKGELRSMLHTFYDSSDGKGLDRYDEAHSLIESFIKEAEDACIQE